MYLPTYLVPHFIAFFFFQAEDGIRDYKVTGVQTCALPICAENSFQGWRANKLKGGVLIDVPAGEIILRNLPILTRPASSTGNYICCSPPRSGERRVGKEGRSRWSPYHLKKKK